MIIDFDEFFINYENEKHSKDYNRFKNLIFEIKSILEGYTFNCELSIQDKQFEQYFIGYRTYHIDKKLEFINVYFKYNKDMNHLTINLTAGHYRNYYFLESSTYTVIKHLIENSKVNYKFYYKSILIQKKKPQVMGVGVVGGAIGGALNSLPVPLWSGKPHR